MTSDDRPLGEGSREVYDGSNTTQPLNNACPEIDQIAELTLDYLDLLNGSRDVLPTLDTLSLELQQTVLDTWGAVDRLMVNKPISPLSDDPIAIALGAVPTTLLDPTALRAARQAQSRRPSSIAEALQRRGWSTTTSDVFRWEQRAEHVAPALLGDLAATLDVSSDVLIHSQSDASEVAEPSGPGDNLHPFLQVLYSDELNEIVDQWARLQGISTNAARNDLHQRVNAAAHRGERTLTARQWKAILVILLANENARREQPNDPLTGK